MDRTSVTVILYITSWLCTLLSAALPVVRIENGTLEGSVQTSRLGRNFFAFQGIPYALPPVGDLRFQPPKPAKAWNGVRSAKKDANMCVQRDLLNGVDTIIGMEDCLYMNVYTPKLPSSEGKSVQTSYPVMVWIHGGAFVLGSGYSKFYSPKYLLDHDVVLVTMNYRLGPLGFLSTEDMVLPGNLGMKDQVQSLCWVQENIARFGGDPNSVTLFGESAGGVSVHYHVISPLSKGLFHRAISQSGTVLCPWALARPGTAKKQAERLGKFLDCPTTDSKDLVACLRGKDAANIIATDKKFYIVGKDPLIAFKPVIEPDHPDAFLKEEPTEALKNGNVNDVPWLTGINSHEGCLKAVYLLSGEEQIAAPILDEKWSELGAISLTYDHAWPKHIHAATSKKVRDFYLGDKGIDYSAKSELIDMYTDAWFAVGAHNAVKVHHQFLSSSVYYYYFSYRGRYSFSNIVTLWDDYGVCHGDEVQYLFPIGVKLFFDMIDLPISSEDANMIHLMTSMWYNFAKTGNPTPEVTEKLPIKWMPVKTGALEYFVIQNSSHLEMSENLNNDKMAFWESLSDANEISPKEQIKDEL